MSVLKESTPVYTADGTQVAVKSFRGEGKPQRVTMLVSKEQWEDIKNQSANTEDRAYDVATAGSIIQDWASQGHEIYWKTAADHNAEARDLENHRFRNNPDVSAHFDAGIDNARGKGRSTMKSNLRAVESMDKTFKEYLMEYGDVERGYSGDMQLANQQKGVEQHQSQQQQGAADFQKNLKDVPEVNDVIENNAGRFVVTGKSPEGIQVRGLTGPARGKITMVPQTSQYEFQGVNPGSGKKVWKELSGSTK